ncbi:hypothetical protein LWI29_012572 [Acer saccharum]|uniref:Protein kinase domain-containing protein n=1 Tax=Acer saccharum TaxID=4024 RepID=A0AA39RMM2_ACESA|nr:hypothetical protein LWI29_012572 [Acer saccharum]
MSGLSNLFEEWRAAITLEARNSSKSELILTAVVYDSPDVYSQPHPIDSMQRYLNWIIVDPTVYSTPDRSGKFTAAPSALYDPTNNLVNSADNGIGAPANGPAISSDGVMEYKEIKDYIERFKAHVIYNSTYVVNYCSVETDWIAFDDVEAIRAKVYYAKEKGLLGYNLWPISLDSNWVLSQAAALQDAITISPEDNKSGQNKWPHRFLVIILPITAAFMLLLGLVIYFWWMRKPKSKAAAGDFNGNSPTLILYSLADIETATDKFSIENKLGEGGYGPVYKGVLQDGLEVAVKKLSKTSIQGFEEFKNEPKISDFGMARIFTKDGMEANTERIVGTYGYAPPEYVKKGIYSTKSDVYSFGVLLLQIISGKRVSTLYGENDNLSLLEYAYELWKDGKGMEFMDPSLDDTYSPCTLIRCLHVALLCVQKIPVERPSVLEVSWMLRNEATNLMIPNMPGFTEKNDEDVRYDSTTSNLELGSVNDMTESSLEAR